MRLIDADALDLALDQVKLNDLLDTLDALRVLGANGRSI